MGGVGACHVSDCHGTKSTFEIFIVPSTSVTVTRRRYVLGSSFAPAALVTSDVAATRTVAVSPSTDSTADEVTLPLVVTSDFLITDVKSFDLVGTEICSLAKP